jgi:anti-sigma factor RsiW
MTDMCGYPGDRDEALIAYLYDEIDPAARAVFGAHLATCVVCRDELRALGGVRQQLARWSPPEPCFVVNAREASAHAAAESAIRNPHSAIRNPHSAIRNGWWREIPAWAQVAAALLFLGVSAGIANLDVHYDRSGLTVRTGWSRAGTAQPVVTASGVSGARNPAAVPIATRDDLAALERQLRGEFRAAQTAPRTASAVDARPLLTSSGSADADLMRRVRALVDDTEKRQQRELALRIGEVLRDVNAQRQADLVRIDRSLGLVENNLGVEVLKQRQSLNYLMRVNQR